MQSQILIIVIIRIGEVNGHNYIQVCSIDNIRNKGVSNNFSPFVYRYLTNHESTHINSLCLYLIIIRVYIENGYLIRRTNLLHLFIFGYLVNFDFDPTVILSLEFMVWNFHHFELIILFYLDRLGP